MTIDSTWLSAFKEDLPHAFTPHSPFRPTAVFVDGQIRLMQGYQSEPLTWDDFIRRQFASRLERFFAQCDVVILAFDNYDKVPRAKCMTQAKRRRNVPVLPFSATSELPCMVPDGERWTQCIANRVFKTRVIDLVILRLPALLLSGSPSRRLIVDFHEPVEYRFDPASNLVHCQPLLNGEMPALGEADLKFTRFADMFGKLLVDSIDGDSIPIALIHHERCLRRMVIPPQISVYRMELNQAKRTAEGRKPRTYEHVNIHALYQGLSDAIAQSSGRIRYPSHEGHQMAMLVALIALTGTDFSRNLPQMSGRSVYGWLPDLWPTLVMAYQPADGTGCLEPSRATDQLVALLYRLKFPKHASSGGSSLRAVLDDLQGSKVAQRTKDSLPTYERIACTVRNANWVLAYWTCEPAPDPVQPAYGFRQLANGATEYDD